MNEIILSVKNLSFSFEDNVSVFNNISFDVFRGDYISLLGANGAGKTTLVKIILGILKQKTGHIDLLDKHISYVPQYSQINHMVPVSVLDLVCSSFMNKNKFSYTKEDIEKSKNILKKLELLNLSNKLFSDLSGGQKQRVLLARALVNDSSFIILDEPISNIDVLSRMLIYNTLNELNKEKKTILFISHLGIPAESNRVLFINKILKEIDKSSIQSFQDIFYQEQQEVL